MILYFLQRREGFIYLIENEAFIFSQIDWVMWWYAKHDTFVRR